MAISSTYHILQPSQLTVVRTTSPRQLPPSSKLLFGRTFVCHLIYCLAVCGLLTFFAVGSYAEDSVVRENRLERAVHRAL